MAAAGDHPEESNRRPLMIVESLEPTRKLMRHICFPGFARNTAGESPVRRLTIEEFTEYSFLVHFDALAWHVHRRFSEFVRFDADLHRCPTP
ncbi:hypothetical protein T484DRAFT_1919764 [Baffinella frigidus]|nr:hypothetical protein T484DRAFT_1919764 [Cryptophyta sp. CCMP2293]